MCNDCGLPDIICDCDIRPVRRASIEIRYAKVCLVCEGRGIRGEDRRKRHCEACGGTGRQGDGR